MFSKTDAVQEGLQVRLRESRHVKIRWLPDRDGQWIARVVEEVLKDRDVLSLVVQDLVNQLRVQSSQLVRIFRLGLVGSHQGQGRQCQGR